MLLLGVKSEVELDRVKWDHFLNAKVSHMLFVLFFLKQSLLAVAAFRPHINLLQLKAALIYLCVDPSAGKSTKDLHQGYVICSTGLSAGI